MGGVDKGRVRQMGAWEGGGALQSGEGMGWEGGGRGRSASGMWVVGQGVRLGGAGVVFKA